jgi:hypothetical protein
MKLDPLVAFGIHKATPHRALPQPKPVPSRPSSRGAASPPPVRKAAPPTQEEIDRTRGYVSKLGGVAK